ncbi:tail fiber protein [Colwellia phage 9A]|uniref:Uncharacterized protein n=1 Tax=Colwellia phage 9A TaxID=765765 RepID=I3UMD0_9CAUD|nr:tail fiber protein [Colwellia phage 9A]AFK66645.1 hypothetical protein COPG_00049 [Colwellia phage 9A]
MLNVNTKSGVKGVYSYKVTRENGDIVEGNSKNMILDNILKVTQQYGLYYSMSCYYLEVGSGTTPVTSADTGIETSLATHTGYKTGTYTERLEGLTRFRKLTATWVLPIGNIVGTVTELCAKSGHGHPVSRVLLTDISGNPTSLTLTATDQLTVVYELEVEIPNFDSSVTLNLYGVDTVCRLVSVNALSETSKHGVDNYKIYATYNRAFHEPVTITDAGEVFLHADYPNNTYAKGVITAGAYQNTAQQSVKNKIVYAPEDANGNIYAIGFYVDSARIRQVLTFDPPLPKTSADKVTIEMVVSSTMVSI